jgi:peptidoglycan/xylan/chitin deacetylase (PgdA/CDA1 family)
MLTVDDCHADIYDHLFPIAQELGAPFVIAVPTDFFLRDQWLWFDRVQWVANSSADQPVVEVAKRTVSLKDPEGFRWLKSFLKRTPTVQREQIIDDIARQLRLDVPGSPCDGFEAVSAEQMRKMLDSGLVHVCAHTVTHTIATVMPQEQLDKELRQSKRELEDFSQKEVSSFCYPNGEQGDFDDRTTQAVRAAGFDLALLSVPGINRGNLERYHIRRVHSDSRHGLFEYRASGLDQLLRK